MHHLDSLKTNLETKISKNEASTIQKEIYILLLIFLFSLTNLFWKKKNSEKLKESEYNLSSSDAYYKKKHRNSNAIEQKKNTHSNRDFYLAENILIAVDLFMMIFILFIIICCSIQR